ncbi:MAG: hypothetical protein BWY57_03334 [Betaproteobacteria bacterium ADurb.Bin341]|nr:MAG: hypothetical protein BWY57_03334 [Betaproteobacteria bacterium ADurb.Bin341]
MPIPHGPKRPEICSIPPYFCFAITAIASASRSTCVSLNKRHSSPKRTAIGSGLSACQSLTSLALSLSHVAKHSLKSSLLAGFVHSAVNTASGLVSEYVFARSARIASSVHWSTSRVRSS